jgi:hypothetical protein
MSEPLDIDISEPAMPYFEKWPLRPLGNLDELLCDRCSRKATRIVIDKSPAPPLVNPDGSWSDKPTAAPSRQLLCEACCRKLNGWEQEL